MTAYALTGACPIEAHEVEADVLLLDYVRFDRLQSESQDDVGTLISHCRGSVS